VRSTAASRSGCCRCRADPPAACCKRNGPRKRPVPFARWGHGEAACKHRRTRCGQAAAAGPACDRLKAGRDRRFDRGHHCSTQACARLRSCDGRRARPAEKRKGRIAAAHSGWWRWGESNPRPKMLHARHYMLSSLFGLGWRQHNVRGTPPSTPALFRSRLAGRHRFLSRDDDPTSTSTGTSGFGAYALSGESVDVVVGVWVFAAGLTRKATPSACAVRFRYPRRSQCTPGNCRSHRQSQYRGGCARHKVDAALPVPRLSCAHVLVLAGRCRSRPARSRRCLAPHAFLLWRRITRCFSRFQSRSLVASRLSWLCLPCASASSIFTLLPFQYSAVGTSV